MQKILVIVAANGLRKDIVDMFRFEGFWTEDTDNGFDGLQKTHSFAPDLTIIDEDTPAPDNRTLLEYLKNDPTAATIPLFILGKGPSRKDATIEIESATDDYLMKPFYAKELLMGVRRYFQMNRRYPGMAPSEQIPPL